MGGIYTEHLIKLELCSYFVSVLVFYVFALSTVFSPRRLVVSIHCLSALLAPYVMVGMTAISSVWLIAPPLSYFFWSLTHSLFWRLQSWTFPINLRPICLVAYLTSPFGILTSIIRYNRSKTQLVSFPPLFHWNICCYLDFILGLNMLNICNNHLKII